MMKPIAGELGRVRQQNALEWAAQQRMAKSVRGETPALGQLMRQAVGTLLAAAGERLAPREALRDGAASHGLD